MKTVIITGASRGIGLATAKKFLQEGWMVIATYKNNPVPFKHNNLVCIKCDQSNAKDIDSFVEKIKKMNLKVDALVNNAGIILDNKISVLNVDFIRKTFDVNVFGLIDFTNKVLPMMNKGGNIVNISSTYGSFSFPIDDNTAAGYRMSKAALNMFTRYLGFELEKKNICVSSLDPGWVDTDMGNSVADEEYKPDRKPVQPADEIFELVLKNKRSGLFWKFGKVRDW